MIQNAKAFLGKGWGFPISKESDSGMNTLTTSSYEESVKQSILIILGTRPGERVMNPDFGSHLWDIVFEPNNQAIFTEIRHKVHQSLTAWEPRITIESIDIKTDPDRLELIKIEIKYSINKTNTVHNLVYPFYVGRA